MSEQQVGDWRAAVRRGRAVAEADADELEEHLRDSIAELEGAGLSEDEAFLIAVRRLGEVDALTAEYAREHGDRLWKQLVVAPAAEAVDRRASWPVMLGFAIVAGVLIQAIRIAPDFPHGYAPWSLRDAGLLVLPVVAVYLAVLRRMSPRAIAILVAVVVVLALVVNLYPFTTSGSTEVLVGIHLPVLLWLVVGAAYVGGELLSSDRRMDFLRFTGEWIVYYTLIAIAGAVLVGLASALLSVVAPSASDAIAIWVVPSGAAGATVVAAWLVEAKKSVIENIAPVLTAIFTPLFAAMLLIATVVYAVTGIGHDFNRDLLILFDAVMIVVVGLVIYGISARADRPTGFMDLLRLTAVLAAVLLDLLVVISMLARVGEFGFTANRVAALGLNLVLLVDLVVTAVIIIGMLRRRVPAARLERWQTGYLAVIGAWVAIVVVVLPPVFGFA